MKRKRVLLNHYTIFYFLWIIHLILWMLPRMWIAIVPYNAKGKFFLAIPNLILEIALPIYTIVLIVKDIVKKRYWIALLNLIIITGLVVFWWYLVKLGIKKMN